MTFAELLVDLYLRKSTQDKGKSVASQEAELRDGVEDIGHRVGRVFTDDNRSASRYRRKEREDFPRLVEHIRSGRCQCLGIWQTSRSSRDLAEFVQLLDLMRQKGTLVYVFTHGRILDPRRRADYKILAQEGLDAADESEERSELVLRGKRRAAKAGKPPGRLVYGYRRIYDDEGHYVEQVEEPARAAIVRDIFKRIANGGSIQSIVRDLNEAGVPAPRGGVWRPPTVRVIVRNIAYRGRRVHRGEDYAKADWPAIVDETVWRQANARLDDPRRRVSRGQELIHPLSFAMRCGAGSCTGVLTIRGSDRRGKRRYGCRECRGSSIVADELDAFVGGMMRERLRRRDALQILVDPIDQEALAEAEAEEEKLKERLKMWRKSAAAGKTTPESLAEIEADLALQIEAAAARVRQLSTPAAFTELKDVDLAEAWPYLPVATRRNVTMALADIIVRPAQLGLRAFDRWRLRDSRWRGDPLTWGEHWRAAGVP